MRYSCHFANPHTNESKTIVALLTVAQVQAIESMRDRGDENTEVQAMACALQHAYREVPDGFRHTEPPTPILTN